MQPASYVLKKKYIRFFTKKLVISLLLIIPIILFSQTKTLAAGVVGDGSIDSTVTIDDRTTNGPTLADDDYYSISVTSIGDLNGDSVSDIAVGTDGDDGAGSFPWKLSETLNDGHEFLPNVTSAQQIKIKPYNHCAKGSYSIPVSYNLYPGGWYNVPE